MEKHKTRLLQWFVEFVNLQIDELSPGDKAKLATELDLALSGKLYEPEYVEILIHVRELFPENPDSVRDLMIDNLRAIRELQDLLKDLFDALVKGRDEAFDREGNFIEKDEFEHRRRPVLREMKLTIETRILAPITDSVPEDECSKEPSQRAWRKGELKTGVFDVGVLTQTGEDALAYQFITALHGLPLQAMKQCKECKKWFLHLSERKKEYCSNQCAARKGRKDRYQKMQTQDPASYLAELQTGAERARKSYEKKMKKKKPAAKVARNPKRTSGGKD